MSWIIILPLLILYKLEIKNRKCEEHLLSRNDSCALRGISAWFVMAAHFTSFASEDMTGCAWYDNVANAVIEQLGGIGVLIFFFVSGYGIYMAYGGKKADNTYIRKRLKSVYLPYVIIKSVFLIVYYALGIYNEFSVKSIISIILVEDWFVHVIVLQYIIFYVISRFLERKYMIYYSLFADIILSIFFACEGRNIKWFNALWLFTAGMCVAMYEKNIVKFLNKKTLFKIFMFMACFISMGIVFTSYKGLMWANIFKPVAGAFICLAICGIYRMAAVNSDVIVWSGKRSLYLYIVHLNVWNCMAYVENTFLKIWGSLILTLIVTEILYMLITKIMNVKKLFVVLCISLISIFTIGAAFEEETTRQYAFWADTEEDALKTATELGGKLVSFSYGVGVVEMEEGSNSNGVSVRTFNAGPEQKDIVLYPEVIYTLDYEDGETKDAEQWHLGVTGVESVWDQTKGKGIKVAVIDTGIDTDHEDLKEGIVSADTSIPSSEYGDGGTFDSKYEGAEDYFGHGTHVAGIVGARRNGFGCNGIAPECDIISIKSLDKKGSNGIGKTSWVVAGVRMAVDKGADVINMSLGGTSVNDTMLHEAITYATDKGCIVVCAAGNISGGEAKVFYPGEYKETIAVSGLDRSGDSVTFAEKYSNFGDCIDISAPGTAILSTVIGGGYGTKTGTSMAAPIVSGSVALLLSIDKSLTNSDILGLFEASALDLGEPGKDVKYGYGALDIKKLIDCCNDKYRIAAPEAEIPDGSVVGMGTPVKINMPENAVKLVYTTDGTEPGEDSAVYPEEGMVFGDGTESVTLKVMGIGSSGNMGAVSSYAYRFVRCETEIDKSGTLDGELLPQYSSYIDPSAKVPCRRYKLTVPAGETLTVEVSSAVFAPSVCIYDNPDSEAKAVKQSGYNQKKECTLSFRNNTKSPKDMWISVMYVKISMSGEDEDTDIKELNYNLSWKCETVRQDSSSKDQTSDKQSDEQSGVQSAGNKAEEGSQNQTEEDGWLYTQSKSDETAKTDETAKSDAYTQIHGQAMQPAAENEETGNNTSDDTPSEPETEESTVSVTETDTETETEELVLVTEAPSGKTPLVMLIAIIAALIVIAGIIIFIILYKNKDREKEEQ